MKIKEALKLNNYSLAAEVLLCFVLKKDKTWLLSHPYDILTSDQTRRYQKLIFRRQKGEPVAYLINHKEFFGLDFYVDESVLIPRPETEILIEEGLKILKFKNLKILDLGTGSGNIVISLAKNIKANFYASDISQKALKIAQKNAKRHKVKIKFIKSDLFANMSHIKFNLIIANLPYLWKKFPKFEPATALNGGKNGLEIIEKFLCQVKKYLDIKSVILIEIDPRQTKQIKELSKKYLPEKKIKIKKDLADLDRIAIIS